MACFKVKTKTGNAGAQSKQLHFFSSTGRSRPDQTYTHTASIDSYRVERAFPVRASVEPEIDSNDVIPGAEMLPEIRTCF